MFQRSANLVILLPFQLLGGLDGGCFVEVAAAFFIAAIKGILEGKDPILTKLWILSGELYDVHACRLARKRNGGGVRCDAVSAVCGAVWCGVVQSGMVYLAGCSEGFVVRPETTII